MCWKGDESGLEMEVSEVQLGREGRGEEKITQKSAADAFGSGSVPARALRANMNMNSSDEGGW